ncbi:MAG: hydantoinase/oxoprolinase family protein [Acidimicrobiia bacterium]|nr:hydantoinase/oxoprolinase family protein [Acidimicrobiia bacterium]
MTLGVDVGGTFTDLAWWDGTQLKVGKTSSTPDQSEGVVAGARDVTGGRQVATLLHGTTVATNALLEHNGARTALVTTDGFADIIEIGRQDRPSLYDSFVDRPDPLVPAGRRFGARERSSLTGAYGSAPAGLEELAAAVAATAPEAVAVSLLYGFASPDHEEAVRDALAAVLPGIPLSMSSEVVGELREYERTSTTVLNAYLTPVMASYLQRLVERAHQAGLPEDVLVMRSSGGLMDIGAAGLLPAAALLSGPAGGVVATAALGVAMGHGRLISFDMGGTSTDVCRIEGGRPEVSYERAVAGYPCRMPSVAVHTVGAGGGSVGWIDSGGALRVGPRSSGARPGPACYDRGGDEPAVTDANLTLGRMGPETLLAGSVRLRPERARAALERLGANLDLTAEEAALGIVEIVEAHMTRAIRAVSVEEGADPRDAMLVAFGGAGGLHATALARNLEMAGVVIPPFAGVFSAFGLLLSPPRHDLALSVLLRDGEYLDEQALALERAATHTFRVHTGRAPTSVEIVADVRYLGQAHETSVRYHPGEGWDALAGSFHLAHRERNGFARSGDPVEVVTLRAEAVGDPAMTWDDLPVFRSTGEKERGSREILTADGPVRASVWRRAGLPVGGEVSGPAVIEEGEATTYLGPGERAVVVDSGALEVSW